MTNNEEFLQEAQRRYVDANAAGLRWLLERPVLHGAFLNTKQNSITLADYGPADGLRGPGYTYGWIQGRGLEALATHAAYFEHSQPELAGRLDGVARKLYHALDALWERDGHAYFCCDETLHPILAGDGVAEPFSKPPADIYAYSDIFVTKGLLAAAARYAPSEIDRHLEKFSAIVDAIEQRRFQMNERVALSHEAVAQQADDFGPRMILLGAAGPLVRMGRGEAAGFADRFIANVLERYFDPASGLLRNTPGDDVCNVGHGIEFVGFALDYLGDDVGAGTLAQLETILLASFASGFHDPGIRLTVSAKTGEPLSPYCPWWSLPETIRSAALAYERSGRQEVLAVWQKAHTAFFTNYWRGVPAIAFQTRTEAGAVDYVPATPDLDPGYHTGLSLLAAINAASRIVDRSTLMQGKAEPWLA